MHAVISLLFQSKKILVISLTDFFDPASRRHNDVIVLPAIRRVSGNDFVFHVTARCAAHVQQLYCTVLTLLSTQPFVRVFSLDFSKAFDSVRHSTLMEKMAKLDLPDDVYN